MEKIVFLVPYYGKFPDYFQEWVYSASFLKEQNIDFFLITDIKIDFSLPENIKVINLRFEQLKEKIQNKFDFNITLPAPYNLCDYKPALGYVFEKEIEEYSFWGNCDIDQVWGNVRKFITDDILNNYDRINFLGHFILYRNCQKINEAFKLSGAIYDYKKVYSSPVHFSFCEHSGMMKIIVENEISNYITNDYADLSPRYERTYISRVKNYKYQILFWHKGRVLRKYIDETGKIGTDEFMYFHFQQKHPKSLNCITNGKFLDSFIYHAQGFQEFDCENITKETIIQNSDFISFKKDKQQKNIYLKKKFTKFFSLPLQNKVLWIKQRIATRELIKNKEYFGEKYSNL